MMPNKLGYFIYHKIQEKSFKNIESRITANQNSYTVLKKILRKNNIELIDANLVEIGSGWFPIMPYFFKINEKVDTIFTFDINKHYSNKRIRAVHDSFGITDYDLFISNGFRLPSFIKYFPKQNIINAKLPKNIKLYYSRFVLEHVEPNDIEKIHKKLFKEMSSKSAIIHLISPSDHRAYSDSSLSYYDFLKYSKAEWNRIQTKFDYHNRLRLPQYLEIFTKVGFKIAFLEYDKVQTDSHKYKEFKKLTIHQDYKQFSEEEILAGSINILLLKP
ncbi:hypothetical protein KO566_04820 [Flavobacteriaceae bacterium XHP0103]|uniref:hypothetical protein n=1 Tax=Marixanthotalea marina TaxID=2844359 RepID=UPI002989F2BD|nr:hypothetical protein [Marixanthotalea marina]MBU3821374.1 hypothetical protein [Marixanthotalea marina]